MRGRAGGVRLREKEKDRKTRSFSFFWGGVVLKSAAYAATLESFIIALFLRKVNEIAENLPFS